MVGKGCKFGFLEVVLGRQKYGTVIGNPTVKWIMLEDPRGYDKTIQSKDTSFDQSKGEKNHAREVIECKKFLGAEESMRTILLQVVENHI